MTYCKSIGNFRYDSSTEKNDIALIKLDNPVTFRRGLRPACLPDKYKGVPVKKLYQKPAVIGWGKTSYRESGVTHLREVYIPLIDNPSCNTKYEGLRNIGSNQICAGDENKDSCGGDSGGPLLSSELGDGKWAVIGVVSFGPRECAHDGKIPGVYARVDEYLDWIESKTKSSITATTTKPTTSAITCTCNDRRETNDKFGACISGDNGPFTYVTEEKNGACCEAESGRYSGSCINYSLCDCKNNPGTCCSKDSIAPPPPTLNCQWSDWSPSGSCTKSCGGGRQRYTRYIIGSKSNGKGSCSGSNEKYDDCNTGRCPGKSANMKFCKKLEDYSQLLSKIFFLQNIGRLPLTFFQTFLSKQVPLQLYAQQ